MGYATSCFGLSRIPFVTENRAREGKKYFIFLRFAANLDVRFAIPSREAARPWIGGNRRLDRAVYNDERQLSACTHSLPPVSLKDYVQAFR